MTTKTMTPNDVLKTYRDYSPTPFDPSGVFLPDRQDWYVAPVGRNRDTNAPEVTNFTAALEMLAAVCPGAAGADSDGYHDDVCTCDGTDDPAWEVRRFGHWGPGWFEIILVKPGTPAVDCAIEIARRLADYPILDDRAWSDAEAADAEESWDAWGRSEFRSGIAEHLAPDTRTVDWIDAAEDDAFDALRDRLEDASGCYPEYASDGSHFPISDWVAAATPADLDAVGLLPAPLRRPSRREARQARQTLRAYVRACRTVRRLERQYAGRLSAFYADAPAQQTARAAYARRRAAYHALYRYQDTTGIDLIPPLD